MRIPSRVLKLIAPLEETQVQHHLRDLEKTIENLYSNENGTFDFTSISDKIWKLKLNEKVNDLHKSLSKKIKEKTEEMKTVVVKNEEKGLLQAILEQWNVCRRGSEKLEHLFVHYDDYINRKSDQPNKQELPIQVGKTAVHIFRDIIILPYKFKIESLIMTMVEKYRKHEIFDVSGILKSTTDMLMEIGKEDVYMKILENPLLEQTKDFYSAIAMGKFDTCTTVDYLKKVEECLKEEESLAKRCFTSPTVDKIRDAVSQEMIVRYQEEITTKESGVRVMLKNKRVDELKWVYKILGRVENALKPTIEMVKKNCIEEGMAIIEAKKEDEEGLITSFISLRNYYNNLLNEAFSKNKIADAEFSQAIKEAFKITVNKNKQFPEYLSLVLDHKLKKGRIQVDDTELEKFFDDVILIFHHVKDKDYFEKYYNTHLAKRLLSGKSANEDAEKSFLKKLKEAFGYNFTSKLEGMFRDMKLSEEMNQSWKQKQPETIPFQLSVQMLTQTYWPVSTSERCNFPNPIFEQALASFETFYHEQHSGRRVNWQLNMGTADVRANGYVEPYEFTVSTHQMVILLLFNTEEKLKVSDVAERTKININELKRALISLTLPLDKAKKSTSRLLLKKFGESKKFDLDTVLRPNTNFSSQKTKMRVIQAARKENAEQRKETNDRLGAERNTIVEAVIVRIMKQHKKLSHMELTMEVNKQIQTRFTPSPKMIKHRIESLIEREYLDRSETDRKMYIYRA